MLLAPTVIAERLALVPDALIDGLSDKPQKNRAVLIEGDTIVEVVNVDTLTPDVRQITLPGQTLMPGLINGHEHPLIYGDNYQNVHLSGSSAYKTLLGLAALQGMLQHGWTTVRVMGDADVYFGNQDIARAVSEGVHQAPRITGAGHYLSITGGGGDINYLSPEQAMISDGYIVDGAMEVRRAVRREIKFGSDWIKILVTGAFHSVGDDPKNVAFSPDELAEAVAEANRHGVPVAAHAHANAGINQAIEAGVRSIEHGTYLDAHSIELMVEHGTFLVPTIYVGDYYAGTDKLLAQEKNDDVYLNYRDEWLSLIGQAHRAGVKVVVGSDLGGYNIDPRAYAREIAVLTEAGLSPMAAIKAATSVAADMLQWSGQVGSVQAGRWADLIAVSGNPLTDLSLLENPAFVMKGGEIVRWDEAPQQSASYP
ncbi:MAG: amidohydrolase family protein [Halieaceae bacterium]|nr:amidohydrolase family protein [Halieaceae bacterium]